MSEALTIRGDMPPLEIPKGIDIRRAMAGIYHLQGHGSMYRCLVRAGFSRSTARNLTRNGITAELCVAEASKLDPMVAPAKLLEAGRRRLAESMAFLDPAKAPLRDVVRLFEATEKMFGGHEISASNALCSVADRLSQVAALLAVAQSRGLPIGASGLPVIEAKVVSEASDLPKSVEMQPESDKSYFVNSTAAVERVEIPPDMFGV